MVNTNIKQSIKNMRESAVALVETLDRMNEDIDSPQWEAQTRHVDMVNACLRNIRVEMRMLE